MRVRDHVLISTAAAVLAAPFMRRATLTLWAGGVLIDADHYVWYCLKRRQFSPLAAVRFFNQSDPPQHSATRALHAPPVLLMAFLLGLRERRLLPVVLGMGLHVALDAGHQAYMDRARSAALARDKYSCQACGVAVPPIVAHVWRQPKLLPSYRVQNLISLCAICHEAAHARSHGLASWM